MVVPHNQHQLTIYGDSHITYSLALYLFRVAVWRNHPQMRTACRWTFLALFYGLYMTNYSELHFRDSRVRACAPNEIVSFIERHERQLIKRKGYLAHPNTQHAQTSISCVVLDDALVFFSQLCIENRNAYFHIKCIQNKNIPLKPVFVLPCDRGRYFSINNKTKYLKSSQKWKIWVSMDPQTASGIHGRNQTRDQSYLYSIFEAIDQHNR